MRSYKLSQEEADGIERLLKGGDNSDIDSDDELVENVCLSALGRGVHQHAYSCFEKIKIGRPDKPASSRISYQ